MILVSSAILPTRLSSVTVRWIPADFRGETWSGRLEDALRQVNFKLSEHYPLLKVMFYTLDVKLEANSVVIWYGPKQKRLEACKPIHEVVAKKLPASHKKITDRGLDDETFASISGCRLHEESRAT